MAPLKLSFSAVVFSKMFCELFVPVVRLLI